MQKPLALSIAACLGLAGCQVSPTWQTAVSVRPGAATQDPDPSHAYAAKLHGAFAGQGVEHKVVTYQYRYTTRLREEAVGTRTAVVYRDETNNTYPWWLKDDRLNTPFWLPNGTLDKQLSFYIRRQADVIETQNYPGHAGSGKSTLAFAKPAPTLRPVAKPHSQVAATKVAPVKKAPGRTFASLFFVHQPAPAKPLSKPFATKKSAPLVEPRQVAKVTTQKKPIQRKAIAHSAPSKIKLPEFFARKEETAPKPAAPRNTSHELHWTAPAVLDANQQSALTAPRDERMEKLFRARHGTDYNRFSPADRRKMLQLQQTVASRD